MGFGALARRPLLAASAAFLVGAHFGIALPLWAAAAALPFTLLRGPRAAAIGLALGLLRGATAERARPFALPEEFVAEVVGDGVVRVPEGRLALRLRGLRVHRGDVARFVGKVHEPPARLNPGGRDRRSELQARGIALEGSAEVVQVLSRGPALWRFVDEVRERFAARAGALLEDDEAGLVTALAVADRSGLSRSAEEDLAKSGLVHLLASSGLHLAVSVWIAREIGRRAFLRTRWAATFRASAAGAALALPFAGIEVLLLGAPWPAVRAGVGAASALAGTMLGRRRHGLSALLFAAAVCAAIDPAATHDLALELSVLGISGLLLLAAPVRDLVPLPRPPAGARWWRRGAEHLLVLACATCAASLCTAPLLAATFHRVSLISVLSNALGLLPGLAAIPVATALIFVDALPLWWMAHVLASATLGVAHLFADVPFATVALAAPGIAACLLWYAGVAFVARGSLRRAAAPWSALAAVSLLPQSGPARLRVTFLAVGQGDCAIVQFPRGGAMLVDAGGDLRWPGKFDPGARDIAPALAEMGISRLDVVVLTHPHPDHAGGLLTVLDRVSVGELWMTPERDAIASAVRAKATQRGVPVRGPHPFSLGGVRVEVPSRFHEGRSLNDNSIVVRIVDGKVAALFAGDIEALTESELAQGRAELHARLLKAPHHGSATSSTEAFIRRVAPHDTVYCIGAANRFGFPDADAVARTPGRHYRTDAGAVIAESDGERFLVHGF